jgi:dodecin
MPKKNTAKSSQGDSGHEHSEKAERMAGHIEESEEKRGLSPDRAEEIAWRTVHKDLPHEEREEKEGRWIVPGRVAKVTELIGHSDKSWQEAAEIAVDEAAKTIRGITGVEVKHFTGKVKDGKIIEYRANVQIAFGVEGT